MKLDDKLIIKIEELIERWEYIFEEEIQNYALADEELDDRVISSLLFDTATALEKAIPKESDNALYCWEKVMSLFANLKAFSVYPVVYTETITINFEVAKMIAMRLVEYFSSDYSQRKQWDIFNSFEIPMDNLPDEYEPNPAGISFVPYSLSDGSFDKLKDAISDGGCYLK